ncbi:hypothetical protein ACNAW0_02750 [Micromonospora sp. SL1-18]|uniref:hypothetical protein n=1 Tax=Micromonospora sp. SL1-18 TaxID=3399128 RepID=UPI003A4DE9FB
MTQQHESRWSLNYTGNRVLLGVLAGLLVLLLCGSGLGAVGQLLVVALVTAITYALVTTLRRR